jgi:DNA polymerase III sliding clamp (beta) subunit (PCNA family)
VFPDRPDAARVKIVAGPLLAAVRQAAIVTSEQSKGVDFSFEPGQLVLAGRSAESGESRIELPIEHAEVQHALQLAFDVDPLTASRLDQAQVWLNGAPASVCPESGQWLGSGGG